MGKPSKGMGQYGEAWGNTLKGWGIMGKPSKGKGQDGAAL